jgi:serine/threonine protein phosphatase PrpC
MKFAIAQQSHIGRRPSNEDRLGHWRSAHALLLAAADGMGGHAHGELAAELALHYVGALFRREAGPRLDAPAQFLARAVAGAHAVLLREARSLGLEDTPRTTIVACVVQQGWATWAHVGDSRLYLVRRGQVIARTRDHSVAQRMVDDGWLSEAEARGHPERNRLLQCLGGARAPLLGAAAQARLEPDDVVLLCTDGFWEPLSDRQIVAGLESGTLDEGVARLAGLARERAGADSDNVSALALAWDEPAVPLAAGAQPGPRSAPLAPAAAPAAPDADILRAMEAEPGSGVARLRQAVTRARRRP